MRNLHLSPRGRSKVLSKQWLITGAFTSYRSLVAAVGKKMDFVRRRFFQQTGIGRVSSCLSWILYRWRCSSICAVQRTMNIDSWHLFRFFEALRRHQQQQSLDLSAQKMRLQGTLFSHYLIYIFILFIDRTTFL